MATVALAPADIDAIAQAVRLKITPPDVMSARDAAEFLCMSEDRFYYWRKRWQVPACSHGRYSLRAIKAGLEREARNTFTAASRLAGAGRPSDRRSQSKVARANAGGGET